MPKLGEAFVVIRASLAPLKKGLATARAAVSKAMSAVTSTIKKAMSLTYKWIKRAMLAVVGAVGYAVYSFGGFERAMRKATAVSDVSMGQFNKMSKMAREEAKRLNMNAQDTASAFYFLGSAGLSVKQQLEAFVPTLTLAKAGVAGVGTTAENLVDIMKGFDLPFSQAGYVTDVLAKAATSANATLAQFSDSLKEVAGISKKTNNTLEEMTSAIAVMAGVGFKGSRAGFMMRRVLMRLMDPANMAAKKAKELGVAIYDLSTGKMRPFIEIIGSVANALRGATEEQKNAAFSALFGQRAIAGQLAVFDKGIKGLRDYEQTLKESGGTAQEIADKQLNSLLEQFGRLRKYVKDLATVFAKALAPALRNLTADAIKNVDKWIKYIEKNEYAIAEWAEKVVAWLGFVKNSFWEIAKWIKGDWREAWGFAFNSTIKLLKAFGQDALNITKKLLRDMSNAWVEWNAKAAEKFPVIGKAWAGKVRERIKPSTIEVDALTKAAKEIAKSVPKAIAEPIKKELEKTRKRIAEITEKYERLRTNVAEETAKAVAVTKPAPTEGVGGLEPQMAKGRIGFAGFREAWGVMAKSLQKDRVQENILKVNRDIYNELQEQTGHLEDLEDLATIGA
jgi:TP901 family phage tail tape measure protein